jgi:hypothetical protein
MATNWALPEIIALFCHGAAGLPVQSRWKWARFS